MRIVCLINGGDGLVAYHHTKQNNPGAEVFPVFFDLGLPYSKRLKESMPDYVKIESMHHYKNIMNISVEDGVYDINYPFHPMIWIAIMIYRADKVVMGILNSDIEVDTSGQKWLHEFNSKFKNPILEYPLKDLGLSKKEVIEYSMTLNCATPVLAAYTCRSEENTVYGCGNCTQCLRKRSAIVDMGRLCHIPSPTYIVKKVGFIVSDYANDHLNGRSTLATEKALMEMKTSLVELLKTDDPIKMAKRCNRYAKND